MSHLLNTWVASLNCPRTFWGQASRLDAEELDLDADQELVLVSAVNSGKLAAYALLHGTLGVGANCRALARGVNAAIGTHIWAHSQF